MDFWDGILRQVEGASPQALQALVVLAFIGLFLRGLVPFMKELNEDRKTLAKEQRQFYEGEVMPTLKGLVSELKLALATQREQYEAKQALIEQERKVERERLGEEIRQLTTQVKALTDRIEALEAENKTKDVLLANRDAEIASLKEQLAQKQTALDVATAKLSAIEAGQHANDDKPADAKPDGKATDAKAA